MQEERETTRNNELLLQRRLLLWKITKNRAGFGVQKAVCVNIPSYGMRCHLVWYIGTEVSMEYTASLTDMRYKVLTKAVP
jgi:hypothetical protein